MVNMIRFIMVLAFNLAVLFSLASLGNKMYKSIMISKDYSAFSKTILFLLLTLCAFLIVFFLLDIAFGRGFIA